MTTCDYGCNQTAIHQFKSGLWCCSKHQSSCPAVIGRRQRSRIATMNQIGDDGLTIFQRTSQKNAKSRGGDGYLKSAKKMRQTKRADIKDGLDCYQRTARKTASTRSIKDPTTGLSSYELAGQKARITGCMNGHYHDPESLADYQRYVREVQKYTERSWKAMKHIIDPQGLKILHSDYHLDHIFSKADGYDHDIQPEVIGHWSNLQVLSSTDNIKKGSSSWKTILQLYEDMNKGGF